MYKIYANDLPLHDLRDDDLVLLNPKLTLELNKTGSLTFDIMENHPNANEIKKLVTNIKAYKSDKTSNEHGYFDELLFSGRPLTDSKDFYNTGEIYCEGELAYLNDSIQRPFELHDMTIRAFLELMIANHNIDVEANKRFTVGIVDVVDSTGDGLLYRKNEEYVNTLNILIDRLINRLGGYLKVRNENDVMYLDYVQNYGTTSTQVIKFGENILDLSQFTTAENIITRIIPLGAKDEVTGERLTIKSINENMDFIEDETASSLFGQITKPIVFEDVTTVEALHSKGLEYLQNCINLALTIELSAIDLNIVNVGIDRIKLGDMVRVVSSPHHLNAYFLVTKLEIDMANPSNNKITLGKTVETLTTQQSNIEAKNTDNGGGTIVTDSTTNGNILINGVETNVYTHPTGTNPHGTTKADVGLGNCDNTSDVNKKVLSATKLTTPRTINGVSFDGSSNITISSSIPLPTVYTPTLLNSWVNFGYPCSNVGYYKTVEGEMHFRGVIKNGVVTNGTILFVLPAEHRPISSRMVKAMATNGTTTNVVFLDVSAISGAVAIGANGANTWLSLDGISFPLF